MNNIITATKWSGENGMNQIIKDNARIMKGPYTTWYDKVPGKSVEWNESDWKKTKLEHNLAINGVPEHSYWHYRRIV